jgi:hypothetical protein
MLRDYFVKNKLDLLLRLKVNELNQFEFEKLNTKLSQNGIEEVHNLDNLLEKFAEDLNLYFSTNQFLAMNLRILNIRVNLNKEANFVNEICFFLKFNLELIIKQLMDKEKRDDIFLKISKNHFSPFLIFEDYENLKERLIIKADLSRIFFLSLLNIKFISLEFEFFKMGNLVNSVKLLQDYLISFKRRLFFKSRKINFRMKIRGKKFEDY